MGDHATFQGFWRVANITNNVANNVARYAGQLLAPALDISRFS